MVKITATILTALFLVPISAFSDTATEKIQRRIAKARLPGNALGIEVQDLYRDEVLYSSGANRPLNPASGIKVLTAATALSNLGPNHRFITTVKRSGSDICLIGGGDPSLVSETMWILVEAARRAGISTIDGNLIADSSLFPPHYPHKGSFDAVRSRAFTAPISALSLNYNSLTIYITPQGPRQPAKVHIDPELPLFRVHNRTKTTQSKPKEKPSVILKQEADHVSVVVAGHIGAQEEQLTLYRAVPTPELYAAHLFASHLQRAGGNLMGKIKHGTCPNGEVLVQHESKPLSQIIFGLNKFSNNFIAEMLLRAFGGEHTPESGKAAILNWLEEKKIPADKLILDNGSGLSKKTRIPARTLVRALKAAATDTSYGPEFLTSLPIAGLDGTLKRRLQDPETQGTARAKTGWLSDVVSMTGIAESRSGRKLAYSMLFNIQPNKNWEVRKLIDDLLRVIVAAH